MVEAKDVRHTGISEASELEFSWIFYDPTEQEAAESGGRPELRGNDGGRVIRAACAAA